MHSEILTTSETAKLLGLSPERIRQLHRLGKLEARRTHTGQRIFMLVDVERLRMERVAKDQHLQVNKWDGKQHA